ncbi:hypothetical protein [Saccharophagus degradans]|uniref:MSHA biogenesis protein MshP n=1 Tax=Saccharophagus degradans (strain 2-40 / ATCC 43961 / DSM 17024) TaxID=203122 RepID=Q21LM2_SACD2|nr:hypothetical protein [Saccharophagus degradans]ABD80407.1 conserved hypothetical protein [Saccharophagus degradans 2-40]
MMHINLRERSKGFLMPLAAVLVVGVAMMALAISHMASNSGNSSVQEGLSLQAFYAAESGAQYAMNQLMFDVTSRTSADANCAALSGTSLNFSAVGLAVCSASLTCSVSNDAANTTSFYSVTSSANCGAGDLFAQRTISVSAFFQ